jgi:competence ComEA-like helix-hairpin-helix protein
MAFLLGAALTLLTIQSCSYLRWGTRPTELTHGPAYRIDLNRADRAELLQLPGVGDTLVQRIEDYRREHGGFRHVDELTEVRGIGTTTLERLRPWVQVNVDEAEEDNEVRPTVKRTSSSGKKSPPPSPKDSGNRKATSKKEANLTGRIDINQATREELQRLPGIGPKMSQRIVDEREKAPFKSVDELRRVPGIGPKRLEQLRPHITVERDLGRVVTMDKS